MQKNNCSLRLKIEIFSSNIQENEASHRRFNSSHSHSTDNLLPQVWWCIYQAVNDDQDYTEYFSVWDIALITKYNTEASLDVGTAAAREHHHIT